MTAEELIDALKAMPPPALVLMDIDETDTLNTAMAKEHPDERHICPLQLGTIERCLRLWSNAGDRKLPRRSQRRASPYPERNRARSLMQQAVLRGDLVRPKHCSRCQSTGRIEGHHYDYSKPLDVIWLCTLCHGRAHWKD